MLQTKDKDASRHRCYAATHAGHQVRIKRLRSLDAHFRWEGTYLQTNKKEVLIENGTFNRRHGQVKKSKFLSDRFYDPMDIVQVKYEMLREAEHSDKAVGKIAGEYGFSRMTYYDVKEGFDQRGLAALIPGKKGPKRPHKLTEELQGFIDGYSADHPKASALEIATAMECERSVSISKRTIERYSRKKKPR
jgi:transposase